MPSQAQQPLQPQPTVSWVHPIATRDGTLTKDSRMVNCFLETTENGPTLVKRPGSSVLLAQSGTTQGGFNCGGFTYYISNDQIVGVPGGAAIPLPGITVPGQLTYCISDVPIGTSWIKTATRLWKFVGTGGVTGGVVTLITDVNYPPVTVPGFCYLDGIYYVMNPQGEVIGSALEDGTTWPPLNFIEADLSLGPGTGLYRHLNYLIAYYQQGIQFYFDGDSAQGDVSAGTQLAPVSNASWTSGLASGDSVVEMTDLSFFLARDSKQGLVCVMINGLQMQVISTPFIDKISNLSTLTGLRSFGMRLAGHSFYGLTFPDLNCTLCYDVQVNQWYQWSSLIGGVEQYFVGACYLQGQGKNLMQSLVDGSVFAMDPTVFVDASGPLRVTAVTALYDYGTINYKRIASMFFLGDNINSSITVDQTDDDYQTFKTPKVVSLLPTRKQIQRGGRFRRRAFRMVHEDNTPLRLCDVKLDITVLTS